MRASILALVILSTTTSTMALSYAHDMAASLGLVPRDDGCSSLGLDGNWTSCGGGLPDNLCCNTGSGAYCLEFNNKQSVVCCPNKGDCTTLASIDCNEQGLNVSAFATSPIHSTVIANGLVTCGTKCCPLGYSCDSSNTKCLLASAASISGSPVAGNSTGTPTATVSLTSVPTSASPSTAGHASSLPSSASGATASSAAANCANQTPADSQCNAFPPTAILVGFFPGMILGILLTVFTIVCLGRSGRQKPSSSKNPPGSPMATDGRPSHTAVSEPIYHDTGATRVDFLRRLSRRRNGSNKSSMRSPNSAGSQTPLRSSARVRSLFSSPSTRQPNRGIKEDHIPEVPDRGPFATPERQVRREPSMESITIFSPPEIRGGMSNGGNSRSTTYTDVVNAAGGGAESAGRSEALGAGRNGLGVNGLMPAPAFLGSPGMVDPRRRGVDTGKLR